MNKQEHKFSITAWYRVDGEIYEKAKKLIPSNSDWVIQSREHKQYEQESFIYFGHTLSSQDEVNSFLNLSKKLSDLFSNYSDIKTYISGELLIQEINYQEPDLRFKIKDKEHQLLEI